MRILLCLALVVCALAAPCAAASHDDVPVVTLDQGGKKVSYAILGGKQFRMETVDALANIPVDRPVAVRARVLRVDGNEIVTAGTTPGVRIILDRGQLAQAPEPGMNVILGGIRTGEGVFTVSAFFLLPDDLTLFRRGWQKLAEAGAQATPEAYYDLGDRIDRARAETVITDQAIYREYVQAARQAWTRALERDTALLVRSPEAVRARIARYRAEAEISDDGDASVVRHAAYRAYLAATEPQNDSDAWTALHTGRAHALIGQLYLRLLDDRATAESHLRTARELAPAAPEVMQALRALGYREVEGRMLSPEEVRGTALDEAARTAARQRRIELERSLGIATREREELIAGEGIEEARQTVDQLLASGEESDLRELIVMFETMPGEVAREALFLVASQRPDARGAAVAAGLASSRAWLRKDAAALAVAWPDVKLKALLARRLAAESRPDVVQSMLAAVLQAGAQDAVDMLIDVLNTPNLQGATRAETLTALRTLTRTDQGEAGAAWRAWWNNTRATFKP